MASEAASYRDVCEQGRGGGLRNFARRSGGAIGGDPEELWTAAKLARRDGITATARVLGVFSPSLQKWTDRLEPRASEFAEVYAAASAGERCCLHGRRARTATSCVVEVESASGRSCCGCRENHRHQRNWPS